MGRPRKPESERRSKIFYLRLLPHEYEELSRVAREQKITIAAILRHGVALYLSAVSGSKVPPPPPSDHS
jgi:hypothetical protein